MKTVPIEKKLSNLLTKRLEAHPLWDQIKSEIILPNSEGKVWLIGGTVSRVLCEELYGTKMDEFDFDFICEGLTKKITAPEGWRVIHTKFDNPTFVKGPTSVDLWPLSDQNWIKSNNLPPTIENFFAGVPFTIQAMAYDIREERVIGEAGIAALLAREFRVNNIKTAQAMATRKDTTIDKRMESKAKSMGFTFVPVGK